MTVGLSIDFSKSVTKYLRRARKSGGPWASPGC